MLIDNQQEETSSHHAETYAYLWVTYMVRYDKEG